MTDNLTARILDELVALRRSSEGVEAKQDNLQKSFDGLEAKQDSLQKSFVGLEAKQDSLQKSFVGLEAKQDSLQKSFVGLEAKQDSLQKSFVGLEARFEGLEAKQDSLQKSFVGLEAKQDDLHRYFGVIAEGLRSEIRQVAEGVSSVSERLDRFQVETAREFAEGRAMVKLSYSELDRRLRTLEDSLESLQSRVLRLESATAN